MFKLFTASEVMLLVVCTTDMLYIYYVSTTHDIEHRQKLYKKGCLERSKSQCTGRTVLRNTTRRRGHACTSSGAGENEGARGHPSAPGKVRVQAGERGDDMRDLGRMCMSGEVRANEGARAMRIGARGRGRRWRHVHVWRTRVKEGGQVGEGVG